MSKTSKIITRIIIVASFLVITCLVVISAVFVAVFVGGYILAFAIAVLIIVANSFLHVYIWDRKIH